MTETKYPFERGQKIDKIYCKIAYLYQIFVRERACQSTKKGPVNLKMNEYTVLPRLVRSPRLVRLPV